MKKNKIIVNNTKKIIEAVSGETLVRAVHGGGLILETEVKISMATGKASGERYGKHRASAPGQVPAPEHGQLINSIKTDVSSEFSDTHAEANVGPTVEHGTHLEFGTSKMKPRPFMRPAFDKKVEKIRSFISKFIQTEIQGAANDSS
jgi:HK97 gp10 family phage protein